MKNRDDYRSDGNKNWNPIRLVFVTLLVFSTDKIIKKKNDKKVVGCKSNKKNCINNNCASKLFKLLSFVVVAVGSSYNSLNPSPAEFMWTIFFRYIWK